MTSGSDSPLTGPIETITKGPRQRRWVALGTAIVGTVLTLVGFYASIIAALDGGGSGAGLALVVFLVGIALDVAAVVLAVVTLVKDGCRIVPIVAIVIALLPALLFAYLAISARI